MDNEHEEAAYKTTRMALDQLTDTELNALALQLTLYGKVPTNAPYFDRVKIICSEEKDGSVHSITKQIVMAENERRNFGEQGD